MIRTTESQTKNLTTHFWLVFTDTVKSVSPEGKSNCVKTRPQPRKKLLQLEPYGICGCMLAVQSWPLLGNPMDCSLPGSSVHGVLQARILEGVAIPFSRASSQPRYWTWVSYIAGRFFTLWATRETHWIYGYHNSKNWPQENGINIFFS